EDGIRDRNVTGVQTCALPIYLYSSSELHPRERSFTGLLSPCSIGPTASNPPNLSANLYPMLPDSKFGNTKTLASPFISESGAFFAATLGTNAASNWNSPSIISLGFISLAF